MSYEKGIICVLFFFHSDMGACACADMGACASYYYHSFVVR